MALISTLKSPARDGLFIRVTILFALSSVTRKLPTLWIATLASAMLEMCGSIKMDCAKSPNNDNMGKITDRTIGLWKSNADAEYTAHEMKNGMHPRRRLDAAL